MSLQLCAVSVFSQAFLCFQWAFGVTLWEMMTLGQQPYADIDPFEMVAYLQEGYRIAQPHNCPDEL
jgi:RYK receptor-like tyrosine kinase